MAIPKVCSVSVGVLLFMCIWLLSFDFTESRGAAHYHNAVRSERSGSSEELKRGAFPKTRCCLSSGTAMIEKITKAKFVYNTDQTLIETQLEYENNLIATDGIKRLVFYENSDGAYLSIPNLTPESDCIEYCYNTIHYYIPYGKMCFDYLFPGPSTYSKAGLCPIQMDEGQLYETDQPGVIEAVGIHAWEENEMTATFRRVGNACVPISIDYNPIASIDEYEPNKTIVYRKTVTFEEAPFEASYNDLLALTEDTIMQCLY